MESKIPILTEWPSSVKTWWLKGIISTLYTQTWVTDKIIQYTHGKSLFCPFQYYFSIWFVPKVGLLFQNMVILLSCLFWVGGSKTRGFLSPPFHYILLESSSRGPRGPPKEWGMLQGWRITLFLSWGGVGGWNKSVYFTPLMAAPHKPLILTWVGNHSRALHFLIQWGLKLSTEFQNFSFLYLLKTSFKTSRFQSNVWKHEGKAFKYFHYWEDEILATCIITM